MKQCNWVTDSLIQENGIVACNKCSLIWNRAGDNAREPVMMMHESVVVGTS